MDIYATPTITERITGNPYVGRGIILGMSRDGQRAVAAYFIMGRSANSRNRVFALEDDVLYTRPFDESLVEDPSLIIYAAVRKLDNRLIVTNGDQTDTVFQGLKEGRGFAESLRSREFEPDAPNFTPRISGLMTFGDRLNYEMSILKSADNAGSACNRFTYSYAALPGLGHFIHTYVTDGDPLPTFQGEPERVCIPDDIDGFADEIWTALDDDNKISLYVRSVDLHTGEVREKIFNKNSAES